MAAATVVSPRTSPHDATPRLVVRMMLVFRSTAGTRPGTVRRATSPGKGEVAEFSSMTSRWGRRRIAWWWPTCLRSRRGGSGRRQVGGGGEVGCGSRFRLAARPSPTARCVFPTPGGPMRSTLVWTRVVAAGRELVDELYRRWARRRSRSQPGSRASAGDANRRPGEFACFGGLDLTGQQVLQCRGHRPLLGFGFGRARRAGCSATAVNFSVARWPRSCW